MTARTVRIGDIVLWKDAVLRGTGFPARMLLRTAASESVALIDSALAAQLAGGPAWTSQRDAIETAFKEDARRIGEFLREVVMMPAFREAVMWQNRGAVRGAMASLLKRPAGNVDSKTREYERLVASYLQRYCTKNDTIGFFGPVGWATLDDTCAGSTSTPGPSLLAKRTVYFEHWAIDALANRLSQNRELRVEIAPYRMPTVWLEGDVLHHPIDKTSTLEPGVARLVRACDGSRSARAIAEELGGAEEIYELLEELTEGHVLVWRLTVPTAGFTPERALRAELARLEPSAARSESEAALGELEAARDRVAGAAGQPEQLDDALAALEETFVRLTGLGANRNAGKTYAGRSTLFEDCRRDSELVLGRSVLDRIAAPLALIQTSARWFTSEIAARFRVVFRDHYRSLAVATGAPEVDFIRYYTELRPQLSSQQGTLSPTVIKIREELQQRWGAILALPEGTRRVELRSAELAPQVSAAFAATGPGWPTARHNSPDLMIAATPEGLARGELTVVLGEVHAGMNFITLPTLAKEHVEAARLFAQRHAETGRTIAIVEPRANVRRASFYSLADGDLDIEFGDARSHRPRADVYDVAGFVVVEHDGQVWVRRRDGSAEFDVVAFLEGDLNAESYNFDLLSPAPYRPRVSIDGFVVVRERWRISTIELLFASQTSPVDRFVGARRWATERGLPRFLFMKAPSEPKPMYLDLESPVYVELLCKLARSDEFLTLTEMLPTFDDLWLLDASGAAYCSELRMALVDDVAWSPIKMTR
jgi:hypothetical protein